MQAREVPALPRPARGCSFGEVSRRVLPPIWGLRPSPLILQLICGDVQYGNMRTLRTCRTGAFRRGQGHRGNYAGRSNPSRLSRGRGKCHRRYMSTACAGSRDACWFYRVCISVSWVTPHRGGTARAGRGRSPAPLGALAAGLISLSGRTSAASLYWSACLRPLGRAGLPGPDC